MRGKQLRLVKVCLILVLAICLFRYIQAYNLLKEHEQQREVLKAKLLTAGSETAQIYMDSSEVVSDMDLSMTGQSDLSQSDEVWEHESEAGETLTDDSPVMLKRFETLHKENNDLVGWLSIAGMVIDYPVVQSEDEEYYLHHDFYGEEDKYGCLFVKEIADIDTPGTNFVIYGHNMRDGAMFGDLDLYRKEDFYREHPTLTFDTLYEERTYEIIAVFNSRVYGSEDKVFKYYQFYQADTQ